MRSGEHAIWDAHMGELREAAYWLSLAGVSRAFMEAFGRPFREAVERINGEIGPALIEALRGIRELQETGE